MSYKTILVHADQSERCAQRIDLAARCALDHGAHLIGAAMSGLSRYAHPDGYVAPVGAPFPFDLRLLHARARLALDRYTDRVSRLGLGSFEARLVDDDAEGGLIRQSPYADLLVVGQTDPRAPRPNPAAQLPQSLMLHCVRPVVIVPHAGRYDRIGEHIMLAWDGGMAAARAIGAAMPLLQRARRTTVAMVDPGSGARDGQPGADLGQYLARQGVAVDVVVRESALEPGAALLVLAAELSADLLVMGGYGRPKWREILLGGTTRTILRAMTLPVLMSH